MVKRFLTVILILMMIITLCGISFAADPAGGDSGGGGSIGATAFKDALMGAALGAMLGLTLYLIDNTNIQSKLGVGILIGLIGGAYFGVSESHAGIEINGKDGITLAQPTFIIQKLSYNDTFYGSTLLKVAL